MGRADIAGHDPNNPNSSIKEITVTREQFKEIFGARRENQIWAMDVFPRTIELLKSETVNLEPDGPEDITVTWSNEELEHLSTILLRINGPNGPAEFTTVNITVITLNGTVLTPTVYPVLMIHGQAVQKIPPAWVAVVSVTITTTGAEDGDYTIELHGERSYDVDTELGDIEVTANVEAPEDAPLNVQPLEEIVEDDIVSIKVYDGRDVLKDTLDQTEIHVLFDKHCNTSDVYELTDDYTMDVRLKKTFRLDTLKVLNENTLFAFISQIIVLLPTSTDGETPEELMIFSGVGERVQYDIRREVIGFKIRSAATQNIAEILGELYLDRWQMNPERLPANVKELGQIVAEAVISVTTETVEPEFIWFTEEPPIPI